MQSRLLLNLFLLVTITGLSGWLLLGGGTATDPQSDARVSAVDPDSISRITLSRPDKPGLVFERTGVNWQITEPINSLASPFRINSLLSLLQAHSISTVVVDPARIGLAESDRPVTLLFDNHRFRLGSVNPLDQSRYVEYQGAIHLIEDTLYPQLLQAPAFFADTSLTTPTTTIQTAPVPGLTPGN